MEGVERVEGTAADLTTNYTKLPPFLPLNRGIRENSWERKGGMQTQKPRGKGGLACVFRRVLLDIPLRIPPLPATLFPMKSWKEIRQVATVFSKRWALAYDEKSQA